MNFSDSYLLRWVGLAFFALLNTIAFSQIINNQPFDEEQTDAIDGPYIDIDSLTDATSKYYSTTLSNLQDSCTVKFELQSTVVNY